MYRTGMAFVVTKCNLYLLPHKYWYCKFFLTNPFKLHPASRIDKAMKTKTDIKKTAPEIFIITTEKIFT